MEPRPQDPGTGAHPLPADEPVPPGSDAARVAETVDEMDQRIREGGSEDAQVADRAADEAVSGSDPDEDPTDDGADSDTPA
ncbi:hypothetical protein [Ornithinicoccus hortensis]|uniref:Uncharacterized protein n=1 Tax=Ornithinicoccus hortensis TaxID=82346 RepID=A0A542YNK4_9MICO|nr:hypothetical protein [Ornithinicoccus hortensis]TQL49641.1 hypothetical protein FB467_0719 [Ornithinicoccus hortensis]